RSIGHAVGLGVAHRADLTHSMAGEPAGTSSGPDSPAEPTSRDQLMILVGRVAQADVQLEYQLREMFAWLCVGSLAQHIQPLGFGPTHAAVTAMLSNASLSDDWRAAVDDTLQYAKDAHTGRNRVVHDMWMPVFESGPPDWQARRFGTGGDMWKNVTP